MIRRIRRIVKLTFSEEKLGKKAFCKRNIFASKSILNHFETHLSMMTPDVNSEGGNASSDSVTLGNTLHMDEEVESNKNSTSQTDSTSLESATQCDDLETLLADLPNIACTLVGLMTTHGGDKSKGKASNKLIFDVVVKTIARRQFYGGQVQSRVALLILR